MLSILSWNIRQGGGTRVPQISKYLIDKRPDVIVLSEFRNNEAGNLIRRNLIRSGYIHQGISPDREGKNSVCICSHLPFSSHLYHDIDPNYSHCLIKASFQTIDVFGVYMPHKKKHQLFDYLIEQDFDKPTVICGDYNSGINEIDQKGRSFWYEDKLLSLLENRFIDAFRQKHPDAKEYSWYSHQGNGYRYDHSFVTTELSQLVKECYYDHEARETKMSDHSPMMLIIG